MPKAYTPKVIKAAKEGGENEILVHGPIGGSFWSDEGITGKEFTDALNEFPKGTKVTVGVNSQGGAVGEGLAIYNAIARRAEDITVRIDGYALSIASFFPLAAGKVISPKSALWMIHNAWSWAQGNAEEMRKAAEMLDTHDSVLVDGYVKRTGKSEKEIRAAMAVETWLKGDQAVEWGLADEESQGEADLDALDFSTIQPKAFRHIPASCPQLIAAAAIKISRPGRMVGAAVTPPHNPAASSSAASNSTKMRAKIIAALKKHGIQFNENATDEELAALLETIPNASQNPNPSGQSGAGGGNPAQNPGNAANADIVDIRSQLKAMQEAANKEKKDRITAAVQKCVDECRIPAAQRDSWVARAMVDEAVLADLQAMPINKPGEAPVAALIEVKAESIKDIVAHCNRLGEARRSWLAGNSVKPDEIHAAAVAFAGFYQEVKARLLQVWNTNTIPAELKRSAILQESLRAFAARLMPIRAFSTVFANVPLVGTDKVEVPYYDLDTTASTDFVQANGYQFGNSTTTFREVEVNKRKYKGLAFNSQEMARQPYLNVQKIANLAAEKLAVDVFNDILSIVKLADYGAPVKQVAASAFFVDDVIDIRVAANKKHWPEVGRSLIVNSDFDGNLQKDASVKNALNYGGSESIRQGKVPVISGFDYYESPSIPENGQGLSGMAVFPSAMLVATAPILPAPGVRKVLVNYDVVVDPQLGIAFEYRYWGEPQPDSDFEVIECNYGYAKGNADALLRIVNAGGQ